MRQHWPCMKEKQGLIQRRYTMFLSFDKSTWFWKNDQKHSKELGNTYFINHFRALLWTLVLLVTMEIKM